MKDKYNVPKRKKPETKAEILAQKIEELVKQRDQETDPVARQKINAQLTKLFAQYEGLRE